MCARRATAILAPVLAAAVAALAAGAAATPALARGRLVTGFMSLSPTKAIPSPFARAAREGAGMVRVNVPWASVAPARRPHRFRAGDPASPGYDFSSTDQQVRAAQAHGLRVVLTFTGAPAWAEGSHRPSARRAPAGTWRPHPRALAAFATALARRYSGRFPDPDRPGRGLPRVRYFQPWNEPNLSHYLTPQWTHGRRPASPAIYRRLLNASYRAIKRVSRRNVVIAAGTAPYGDPPGGLRMRPVVFTRELLCLRGPRLRPERCRHPARLDGIDNHPYGVGAPLRHALSRNDVAVPDVHRLTHVLHVAQRHHRVLPARERKRIWTTEISWDTRPPDPDGVPVRRQARWLEQSFELLWRQGVRVVLWLQLADAAPTPSYATTYQGGIFFRDGRAKPAARAFRFPFVSSRAGKGRVRVWGRAPRSGKARIERREHGRWVTVRRLRVRRQRVFQAKLRLRGPATLRARVGSQRSLAWRQR